MKPRVAIATARHLPLPDPDAGPLEAALLAAGVDPQWVAWDDEEHDWSAHDLVVVRSTWDYVARRDAFVAWARRVETATRLMNPAQVIEWNTDKIYLRDRLEAAGVPVVPTLWLERGEDPGRAVSAALAAGFVDVVAKPRISAGSFATERFRDAGALLSFLAQHLPARPMMLQPYQARVDDEGERSHVFLAGELSHAVRKAPRFAEGPLVVAAEPSAPDMLALAERCHAALGHEPLYARVDLVRSAAGAPQVMEVELTEPYLMLDQAPGAAERLASAITRLVAH